MWRPCSGTRSKGPPSWPWTCLTRPLGLPTASLASQELQARWAPRAQSLESLADLEGLLKSVWHPQLSSRIVFSVVEPGVLVQGGSSTLVCPTRTWYGCWEPDSLPRERPRLQTGVKCLSVNTRACSEVVFSMRRSTSFAACMKSGSSLLLGLCAWAAQSPGRLGLQGAVLVSGSCSRAPAASDPSGVQSIFQVSRRAATSIWCRHGHRSPVQAHDPPGRTHAPRHGGGHYSKWTGGFQANLRRLRTFVSQSSCLSSEPHRKEPNLFPVAAHRLTVSNTEVARPLPCSEGRPVLPGSWQVNVCPEDLDGHSVRGPTSSWSLAESGASEGGGDTRRGAVFWCWLA